MPNSCFKGFLTKLLLDTSPECLWFLELSCQVILPFWSGKVKFDHGLHVQVEVVLITTQIIIITLFRSYTSLRQEFFTTCPFDCIPLLIMLACNSELVQSHKLYVYLLRKCMYMWQYSMQLPTSYSITQIYFLLPWCESGRILPECKLDALYCMQIHVCWKWFTAWETSVRMLLLMRHNEHCAAVQVVVGSSFRLLEMCLTCCAKFNRLE